MALARLHRKVEYTEGEGDCAFNAFSLALCEIDVLDHIEEYFRNSREEIDIALAEFISDMSNQLHVEASWEVLKIALLQLRDNPRDKVKLQRTIAPILRDLSITIISRYEDILYQLNVYNDVLRREYKAFKEVEVNGQGNSQDRLFSRYAFIWSKFTEISSNSELAEQMEEQEERIIDWWWGWHKKPDQLSGCMQFKAALDSSGKKGPPHSDLKLVQVANALTPDVINHRVHMSFNLLSSYDCYKSDIRQNGDDTFNRHSFIKDKFYEIKKAGLSETEEKRVLLGWWWKSGNRQFLREMRQSGKWAGDLELTILADYFRIAFFVVADSDENLLNKHSGNYGYFPHLNERNCRSIPEQDWEQVKRSLIDRMVIDRGLEHEDGLDFRVTSLQEMDARLRAVPGLEGFDEYVKERMDVLEGMEVPEGWPQIYLDLFVRKGILHMDQDDGTRYRFAMDGIALRTDYGRLLEDCGKEKDFAQIQAFIDRYADRLKLTIVPEQFLQGPECVKQLIHRNVIERVYGTKDVYKFSVGVQAARRRVAEIMHYHDVMAICRHHFQELAEIVLYKTPKHWSNTVFTEEEAARRAEVRQRKHSVAGMMLRHNGFFSMMPGTSVAFTIMSNLNKKESDDDVVRRLT